MVAPVVDQPAGKHAERLGAQAVALPPRVQEQVDPRIPVLRIELLVALDVADPLPIELDDKLVDRLLVGAVVDGDLVLAPPLGDRRVGDQRSQRGAIVPAKAP